MLYELEKHFAAGGCFSDCSLAQLEWIANNVYKHYMTTEAYQSTIAPAQVSVESLIFQELQNYRQNLDYTTSAELGSILCGPESDQLVGNIILFMRDAFWYLKLASAIPEGDTGRVFEIIKEHSNKAIKTVFNSKNPEWDSRFLRNPVSVNIEGLSRLRASMIQFLGLQSSGTGRPRPDYSADINVLASHYLRAQAFVLQPGRSQDVLATDMFDTGINKLNSGGLKSFLDRTALTRAGQLVAPATDISDHVGDGLDAEVVEGPLRPLVMDGGELVEEESGDELELDG
ncbi:hypothetical protein FRC10_003434 [Ceratobasidium sp. 414]|nr:hypothetical protein FRC10_003434 [Ceratobasidium sp. 414]